MAAKKTTPRKKSATPTAKKAAPKSRKTGISKSVKVAGKRIGSVQKSNQKRQQGRRDSR
jgi:hypothetical protein